MAPEVLDDVRQVRRRHQRFTNLHQCGNPAMGYSDRRKEHQMTEHRPSCDANGMAALGICESLLLALTDLKVISDKDARDLLTDVATTHTDAATTSPNPANHQAVVDIVQRIIWGKNGVRH